MPLWTIHCSDIMTLEELQMPMEVPVEQFMLKVNGQSFQTLTLHLIPLSVTVELSQFGDLMQ